MTAGWAKGGLILATAAEMRARSHAMLPTPYLSGDHLEVYFAACDDGMRGRIYAVDLAGGFPVPRIARETRLVLDLGKPGDFDCDGVNPCQVVARGDDIFLYYIGWQRVSEAVPYRLFVGLAVSRDRGTTYTRVSRNPILPSVRGEEYFRTAAHIYQTPSGWAALYIGGNEFIDGKDGKRLPVYCLRRAISEDGITWPGPGEPLLLPDRARGEIGFGRPWLWHDRQGKPVLMISARTETGYSLIEVGFDAENRLRRRSLIEPSAAGWDCEMTCFAAACAGQEQEWLFYNGNGFGRSGFGIARRPIVACVLETADRLIEALPGLSRNSAIADGRRDAVGGR
jgi:hypothetical protein